MKTRSLSLILLTILASVTPAQKNEQTRPPIIDVHVHAYSKDERWARKAPNPRTGVPFDRYDGTGSHAGIFRPDEKVQHRKGRGEQ